ncbi:SPOR domain-containing protein [Fidelibacter multiformis]|uniref:SPOR domain-containing protein n=1 Tax=Fidelibacter multiformis TaxID=3377529 RepID=UPI0037DC42F0
MARMMVIFLVLFKMVTAQVEQDEWIDPEKLKDDQVFSYQTVQASDSTIMDYIRDTTGLNIVDSIMVRRGYRVQIVSTQDVDQAENVADRAMEFFNQPVYIIFESPYYKVRVGDFLSDLDAMDVERKARQNGYPGAWIVPSDVNVPNPNRRYK